MHVMVGILVWEGGRFVELTPRPFPPLWIKVSNMAVLKTWLQR